MDRGDFRFGGAHGYANDDATGWQRIGARLYVPGIGRFLTQDPIGQEGGLNLYAYCDNSPLSKVDPQGTQTVDSVTSTAEQQVARAATDPAGAIQELREFSQISTNAAQRGIFRGALRKIFQNGFAQSTRGIAHSLKHGERLYGVARMTQAQIVAWTAIVQKGLDNGRMFPWSVGSDQTMAFFARVNGGTNMLVQFFTEGPRAGQFASAWQVTDQAARVYMNHAAEFKAGGG